jgi:hypothetical protein
MARLARSFPGFIVLRGPIATTPSWTTWQGAAAFAPALTLTTAGTLILASSAATLSVTAGLSADGGAISQAVVTLTPTASLSSAAIDVVPGAVSLSGTAGLNAAGSYIAQGSVTMSATASLGTVAVQTGFGQASLAPVASLVVGTQTVWQASATLAPVSVLVAGAAQTSFPTVDLTPSAGMTVAATRIVLPGVALAPLAALTTATPMAIYQGAVSFSPAMSLTLASGSNFTGNVIMSGTGALTIVGPKAIYQAIIALVPMATFTVASLILPSGVLLAPVISLTAAADIQLNVGQVQPYYIRQRQDWAIQQERQRHAEAIYWIGEMVCLILMWHEIDFQKGLVQRCHTCYNTTDTITNRITAVYNQPTRNECPDCFGTTFEGGYRARIVRPAILTDVDETERQDRKGSMHPSSLNVETVWDFRSRAGDYLLRADGSRWRLSDPQRTTLRTGFYHPAQSTSSITYGNIRAQYEEETTVAYLLPPTDVSTLSTLLQQQVFFPPNFSSFEIIRAPLIPTALQD